MLLTAIASAQPQFQNDFGSLRDSYNVHSRFSSVSFTFLYEQRFFPWKSSKQKVVNFNLEHVELQRRDLVKAVTTLESKPLVSDKDGLIMISTNSETGSYSELPATDFEYAKSTEHVNREKLRRMKISKANKGNTPWNKGRKHSPETLKRIKERTWLAMQDPKVKMKLANLGHAQSEETRIKIRIGVRMQCERRRRMKMVQESCCFEWQNLIAEASKYGYTGEKELQWDSYTILDVKLSQEWLESLEQKKIKMIEERRAPKSLEQRRKIAKTITAKWADPEYRERLCSRKMIQSGVEKNKRTSLSYGPRKMMALEVTLSNEIETKIPKKLPFHEHMCSSSAKHHSAQPGVERKSRSPSYRPRKMKALEDKLSNEIETKFPKKPPLSMCVLKEYREHVCCSLAKHHSIEPGVERKLRRSLSYGPRKMKPLEEKLSNEIETKVPKKPPLRKSKSTPYKDPLAGSKLAMIKNIRANRAASKTKHIQAIERARLLITEAENAAKALEVAATINPVAHASLIETRKLIAQAVQSIKSIEAQKVSKPTVPSDSVHNDFAHDEYERQAGISSENERQSNQTQINGSPVMTSSTNNHSLNFDGLELGEILQTMSSNGYSFSISHGFKDQMKNPSEGAISQLRHPEAEDSSKSMGLQPSVNEVQIHSRTVETATKSRKVTKKWVRGKLVVVVEEA